MKTLTEKEGKALLLIFKDFTTDYNANSISKKLDITPRGALKIVKNLYEDNLLVSKEYGKAVFYKANLNDNYTQKIIETLLIKESRENVNRWIHEFESLYDDIQIALIFGSIVRNGEKARDIDLLLVFKKEKHDVIKKGLEERKIFLTKPLHPIKMTLPDLPKNLKKKNPAMINAIKQGYVLFGQDKIVEVMKDVTSFQ